MKTVINYLGKFIDLVGYICGLLMIFMIFNVFYNVVNRYIFNDVSIGLQELEWHLFATVFMFGIGYTIKHGGHVRVDVIYDRLSIKTQAWIDLIGTFAFAIPFTALIVNYGYGYSYEAFQIGEGSPDPGGLPYRWVIRSVIPIASTFVIICFVHSVLEKISLLTANTTKQGAA